MYGLKVGQSFHGILKGLVSLSLSTPLFLNAGLLSSWLLTHGGGGMALLAPDTKFMFKIF